MIPFKRVKLFVSQTWKGYNDSRVWFSSKKVHDMQTGITHVLLHDHNYTQSIKHMPFYTSSIDWQKG